MELYSIRMVAQNP